MSARKQLHYRGLTLAELEALPLDDLVAILPARARRSLLRDQYWTPERSKLLGKLRDAKAAMNKGKEIIVRTHRREFVIMPEFVGLTIEVHNGREFVPIQIDLSMVGDYFAEYAHPRRLVRHSAPGIGATRSSMYVPLK